MANNIHAIHIYYALYKYEKKTTKWIGYFWNNLKHQGGFSVTEEKKNKKSKIRCHSTVFVFFYSSPNYEEAKIREAETFFFFNIMNFDESFQFVEHFVSRLNAFKIYLNGVDSNALTKWENEIVEWTKQNSVKVFDKIMSI